MFQRMNLSLVFEKIETEAAARRAVNTQRHAEILGRAKNRPKITMAETLCSHHGRGQKSADHVELFDRVAQLFRGALGILDRQHGDAFQARVLLM